MTTLDISTMSTIASASFTDYQNARSAPSVTDPVVAYWQELAQEANAINDTSTKNYATTMANMAANAGVKGRINNEFLKLHGTGQPSSLEVGSQTWEQVMYDRMISDFSARDLDLVDSGDGLITVQQTVDVVRTVYEDNLLDPKIDPALIPIANALQGDPAHAQELFDSYYDPSGGILSVLGTGAELGFGADIFNLDSERSTTEVLRDNADQFKWMGDTLQAIKNFLDSTNYVAPPGLEDEYQEAESMFNDFKSKFFDGPQTVFDNLADFIDALDQLSDDIQWAIDNPGQLLPGEPVSPWADGLIDPQSSTSIELPPWMQDVIGGFDDATNTSSPLVLDLDGDGIELAALNGTGSIYWDIDVDGMAEASGWITGGDGLLAIDLDADGVINDHAELFGNKTGSANGFVALAAYDTNSDDAITSADTQFDDLLVWVDANADGHSQADELHTLDDLSITSIDLDYSNVNYTISGNEILQESTFTINGQTRDIVDAWFAYDNVNTEYAEDYTLDIRTLFLPNLRGFGNLPDLHIAMSLDETLLDMVQEVAVADKETLLNTTFDLQGNIENILFRWAGVDGIAPNSRGNSISDARKLEFLEELLVEDFIGLEDIADPGSGQSQLLESAFATVLNHTTVAFFLQSDGKSLLPAEASYNSLAGAVEGVDIQGIVYFLRDYNANVTGTDEGDYYFYNSGNANDTIYDADGDDTLVFGDGIDTDDIRLWNANNGDLYIYHGVNYVRVNDHFDGTGEEIETALFLDGSEIDLVNNLTITGSSNSEYVYGLGDDNTLIGLTGNDTLYGGAGSDTYLYNIGDGNDKIYDDAGMVDVIEFGAGIDVGDVRLWNANNGDLYLYLGSNYIKVNDHFDGTGEEIETALFADSTTLDLVNNLTFTGTSYNEYVYGTGNADTLNGLAGNDRLYGYGDGDTLYGDAGNDYLYGGFGDDTLYGGDGGDYLYGEGGADNFVFESASAFNNSDIIQDFNAGDGDALDISDLLIEYDPLTDAITDFVHITSNGTNSFLRVDADGGANNFIQIAQLSNVTGLSDEEALETSGNLITA
ncbi:calcium-binding protein [uncultured Sneathiella sp.]|jgi:hypothetical protein|uniref:calcium-binding protein n=1 Tax=uncultured Sneathiella sp. TaxID=879315 RepID=UPI0030DCA993|tara:strand:+ start:26340 stop:29498 length:3159 start_codon:yes stop_codon:yes gene_type:complete